MKSPDDAHFQMWNENPEPETPEPDPRVVLDANIEGQAWLWDSSMASAGAWLVYRGDVVLTKDLR